MLLNANHIGVQMANVLSVVENECLLRVEAESNNIFDVVTRHLQGSLGALKLKLRPVDVLLIISDLNHKRKVKNFLQILCENHGNAVT